MIDRPLLGTGRIPGPIGRKPLSPFSGAARVVRRQKRPGTAPRPVQFLGGRPTRDGEIRTYDVTRYAVFWLPNIAPKGITARQPTTNAERTRDPRAEQYKVIYVNGQEGNPQKHQAQACALAVVSGGPVEGIYNASVSLPGGFLKLIGDTVKSIDLKATSSTLMNVHASLMGLFGTQKQVEQSMLARLSESDCPASVSLFSLLLLPEYANVRIVGHSQGNLIICNAINALIACRGKEAVSKMRIIAIASPTVFWEQKQYVTQFNMSNDAVGWLSLDAPTVDAAYSGWSGETRDDSQRVVGYERSRTNILTHSFYLYLAELWDKLLPLFP